MRHDLKSPFFLVGGGGGGGEAELSPIAICTVKRASFQKVYCGSWNEGQVIMGSYR